MIQSFLTKEQIWLDKWDDYLQKSEEGSYILLSDWVKSYASYGFDFELCLFLEGDTIIGGFNAVIAKVAFFKFYIIPFGPIATANDKSILNELIAIVAKRATEIKACYCQINQPFLNTISAELSSLKDFKSGQRFKYVFSSNGLNWIDLNGFDEESKLLTLKPSIRRNIRNSYRKGLEFKFLTSDAELEIGYQLFKENSIAANYSIREWNDMKQALIDLNTKGFSKMLAAYKEGELKGCILLLKGGNYYTYILGGSKKEVPDLRTGDFLQWEAIKLSLKEHCKGYNISLGGSKGVIEFKNSFNTSEILFQNSKYHKVINSFLFSFFLYFEKYIKTNKKHIAKLLFIIKKYILK